MTRRRCAFIDLPRVSGGASSVEAKKQLGGDSPPFLHHAEGPARVRAMRLRPMAICQRAVSLT